MAKPLGAEVDSIRQDIARAGGLVNAADLARTWGVSRERVRQLVDSDDFPKPIGHAGIRPVWLMAQTEAWRAQREKRSEYRRPRPTPGRAQPR